MKKISREIAEEMIRTGKVRNTRLEQNAKQLTIVLELNDNSSCTVIYDKSSQLKSYFLNKNK